MSGTNGSVSAAPQPVQVVPHGVQDTAWDLGAHPGTQSVSLVVYTGTVTVTTAEGALTVPAGTTLTWGVDGDLADRELTGTLTVDGTAPVASWHVLWTTN